MGCLSTTCRVTATRVFVPTKKRMIHPFSPAHALEISITNSESEHTGQNGDNGVHGIGGDIDVDTGHDSEGQESTNTLRITIQPRPYQEHKVRREQSVAVSLHAAGRLVRLLLKTSPTHENATTHPTFCPSRCRIPWRSSCRR